MQEESKSPHISLKESDEEEDASSSGSSEENEKIHKFLQKNPQVLKGDRETD